MDIPNILKFMHPNAVWSVGETYESLIWPEQAIAKPTFDDIVAANVLYTRQKFINDFGVAIQEHIDKTAIAKGYRDAISIATYVASTTVEWQQQAETFIAWRDAVWIYSYAELEKFNNGEREAVDINVFLNELPVINWPN